MAATRKKQASPAQIAARKAFAERARSGGFKRRKKVATSGARVKRRATKAPSPAQLAARAKFVKMVRARAAAAKKKNPVLKGVSRRAPKHFEFGRRGSGNKAKRRTGLKPFEPLPYRAPRPGTGGRKPRLNVAGDSSVKSPTRTSSDVRSPTRTATSTEAQTSGNVTVTGGAGRGATTRVSIHTAAPRGTKAKVGKRGNGRGFSGKAPAWTRSKRAKRNGVLLTNGRHDAYSWGTSKTASGFTWKVVGISHGKPTQLLKSGTAKTRARAIGQAKKHVMPFRRAKNPIRMSEAEARRYAPKIKGLTLVSASAPAKRKKKAARFGKPAKRAMARAFSGSGFLGLGKSRKTVRANKGKGLTKRQARTRKIAKASKGRAYYGGKGTPYSWASKAKNPSPASVFSEFRGKDVASKSKATFHGNAAGAVAQLGHLRELKLVGKKLEFGGNALLCADGRKKLHIGGVRFKATGIEEDMGEVRSVTYRSDKRHIEEGVLDYVHRFEGKPPHLIVDAEGYPFLEGGSYFITEDGIEG